MRDYKPVRITGRRIGGRGIGIVGTPVQCSYGTTIVVRESSSVEPHVWLDLRCGQALKREAPGEAVAHLNVAQAREVVRRLRTWIDAQAQSKGKH